MDMKKLYALLIILVVIYVGINFSYNGLELFHNTNNDVNYDINTGGDDTTVNIGSSTLNIENFTKTDINASAVSLEKNGITINISEIDKNINLADTVNNIVYNENTTVTSNQTLNQNNVTVYFLYEEEVESYNADIYFNKNNQNYLITGDNINYGESDTFINYCKDIINSISSENDVNYSRW